MKIEDLAPCALVAVDISRRGGCHYTHENETTRTTDEGGLVREYDGKVVLDDPNEYRAASKLQGKVKRAFCGLGTHSTVGIIVNYEKIPEILALDSALSADIEAFNKAANFTRLDYTCLTFKVEGENTKVLGTMLDGLQDKLAELEGALKSLRPQTIRECLANLTGYVEMLPAEAAGVLESAIAGSKKTANILSRGEKKLSRLDRKLAELAGARGDVTAELEALQGAGQTREMRTKARMILKIMDEKQDTVDQIESVKREIDAVPVSLARFVCMREVEVVPETTEVASEVLARFANMVSTEEIMTEAELDAAE